MKKILILSALIFGLNYASHAQISLGKATSIAKSAGFDVNSLTSSIMKKLTPSLGLTSAQSPSVTSTVTDFLTKKSSILPLQQSDPAAYKSKFGTLFSGLKSKLGTALLAGQMTKFMGLKPATNDPTNVLSQLFY
ncbi:hypothetical protein [Pedobacter sp. MW01-1-1]|uniref:hypothetical protein n=1 Tax=Pedobacter sp. MW01-1-1 TaxID=3383027 RepID=UPI003FEDF871